MPKEPIYDIAGIGIGPFNLGLAALCHSIKDLKCVFIDKQESFSWHPGMLIPGTRLQVPFYADLVTLADPTNPFSFMAFLKAKSRMFRFAIQENYCILRTEYNEYCRWVAEQLPFLRFNECCLNITKEYDHYKIETSQGYHVAKCLVIGTGSVPNIPSAAQISDPMVFHSSDYLNMKEKLLQLPSVTIIGSGQSAAEIFYDLLNVFEGELHWFTRSARFFPMDYSKLSLELSTPDYISYFYSLPSERKEIILRSQDDLYKGINISLISTIYDVLVEKNSNKVHLNPNCELKSIQTGIAIQFWHMELEQSFVHQTSAVILATGYRQAKPEFLRGIEKWIQLLKGEFCANADYSLDANHNIFIQNGEQASHGFNSSDLSLGPYRNMIILNSILGYEKYHPEKGAFQTFGYPHNSKSSLSPT